MRFIFTTSSDISDGPILTFDLETREIRIACHRTVDSFSEELPQRFDDLFVGECRFRLKEMALSDFDFLHESFDVLVRRLFELAEQDRFHMGGVEEIAIEVVLANYDEVIGPNRSERSLSAKEFLDVLLGPLNRAQFVKRYKELLGREWGIC